MRKVLKGLGLLLSVFLVALLIVFAYHRYKLMEESEHFVPMGQIVTVEGHDMHVYAEGEGEQTLVFMSGGGTSSPVLDFKALYSRLTDDFLTVVVEKVGYGFSDTSDVDRGLDSILSDTRQALQQADIVPPYILLPHSMSGLEALYWAQRYPEEVDGIIGLDMAVPEAYANYPIPYPLIRLSKFAAGSGLTRLIPGISESDAIQSGELTEEEEALYRTIFYRRTLTTPMVNEIQSVKENALLVESGSLPPVPIHLFTSNGEETGFDAEEWQAFQQSFIDRVPNGALTPLDAPHYIHNYEYERISDDITSLLKEDFQ